MFQLSTIPGKEITMTQSEIEPTDDQRRRYLDLVEKAARQALEEVNPESRDLQRLITSSGAFCSSVISAVHAFFAANRLVYTGPRHIAEQAGRLRELFPGLHSFDERLAERPLPAIAEGYFAIPHPATLADSYTEAVAIVLAKIAETRRFHNYRRNEYRTHLRPLERSVAFWDRLKEEQQGQDILVVPAQLGHHKTDQQARDALGNSEFDLGVFATGVILLTHPERLASRFDSPVLCAGDDYKDSASWKHMPDPYTMVWYWKDGRLNLERESTDEISRKGTASAILSS